MRLSFLYFAVFGLASFAAEAQVGVGPSLDSGFCSQKTVRETVVYIDDMMMEDGRTDWAEKLLNKLTGSLTPGERVSVVEISAASGQSKAFWSGCWPDYTAEQRADLAKRASGLSSMFTRDPIDALKDQQALFKGYFGQSITKIYTDNKRAIGQVQFAPESAPKKQILRALASDDGRYSNNQKTIRAVVYSDMMENSDLGSVYDPVPDKMPNYGEKLGSRFRRSVFYAFGVAGDVQNASDLPERARNFWSRALAMMSSTAVGFGSDLVIENRIPIANYEYDVKTVVGDDTLEGKMSLIVDQEGVLIDSWIGFDRLSIAGLSGKYKCDADSCTMDAHTVHGLVTKNDNDSVILTGHPADLSGHIGVKSTQQLFDLKAIAPKT